MAGCEWEMEGEKGLLWVGIRKDLCERNAFGLQKSWRFLLIQGYPIKKKLFSAHNDTDFALHQS